MWATSVLRVNTAQIMVEIRGSFILLLKACKLVVKDYAERTALFMGGSSEDEERCVGFT